MKHLADFAGYRPGRLDPETSSNDARISFRTIFPDNKHSVDQPVPVTKFLPFGHPLNYSKHSNRLVRVVSDKATRLTRINHKIECRYPDKPLSGGHLILRIKVEGPLY